MVLPLAGKPISNRTVIPLLPQPQEVRERISGPGRLAEISPLFPDPFARKLYWEKSKELYVS